MVQTARLTPLGQWWMALAKGLNPREFLAENNSYHFFQHLDDLLITGPTNTNVMDLRVVLVK
jgi:hydroxypyruvate reductase